MTEVSPERGRSHLGRRKIRARREKGSLVELADSSYWEVSPGHEIYTGHWKEDTEVTVVPGDLRTTLQVAVTDEETAEDDLLKLAMGDGDATVTEFGPRKYDLEDIFVQIVEESNNGQ